MFYQLIIFGFGVYTGWLMFKSKIETSSSVEKLKNALLSHMLMRVGEIDHNSYEYYKFDGTKLPIFSGYNIINSCFSYIMDINEFKYSIYYSIQMENKLIAINKYIKRNLNTDDQVLLYFEKYIDSINKN